MNDNVKRNGLVARMLMLKGEKGEKGDPAVSVKAGTVTTLPAGSAATVTNSGTNIDAIFDFGIPRGADAQNDYEAMRNRPKIGGVEVLGSKTLDDYGIASNDTLAKSVNSIRTQIGSMSTTSPTFVKTVADMTDTTKNYVLTTSGTVYAYIDNAWTDTGINYISQGNTLIATGINIYDAESLAANSAYADFDAIPTNVMAMYSFTDGVKNMPTNEAGLVVSLCSRTQDTALVTNTQIYFAVSSGYMWFRTKLKMGWTKWVRTMTTTDELGLKATQINIYDAESLAANDAYADFDTIPTNVMAIYSYFDGVKNMPEQASGLVVSLAYKTDNAPNVTNTQIYFAINSGHMYFRTKLVNGWTAWSRTCTYSELENAVSQIGTSETIYPNVALFETVGVIGDSYASGEVYDSGGALQGDVYSISWPQIMARRNGIVATNFSSGGLTTRTWLTSSKGLSLLNSESAKKLYILALGINDKYALGLDYLGSPSDIHVGNPSENADTFYGNYAKIIEAVKAKAPNAIILMATINGVSSIIKTFNQAINAIANTYALHVLDQQSNEFLASSWWTNQMHGGHPTAPSYSGMATAFEELIGRDMYNHPDYYNNYFGA